jgi:hypothetical protein
MIKLEDTLTILERNNNGSISSIIIIQKEAAESYADYWYKEESQSSEPEDGVSSIIDKLLRSIN